MAARRRKATNLARGTVFVLAATCVQADQWAAAVGLSKDRYRYVVNPTVFDVMGRNDTYGYVDGIDLDHGRYTEFMAIVRDRDLEWCGRDAYALTRRPDGTVPPRPEIEVHGYAEPTGKPVLGPDGTPRARPCTECGIGPISVVHGTVAA